MENQIKKSWLSTTIISTDDEEIAKFGVGQNIRVHNRSEENASDEASMRETLKEIVRDCEIDKDDFVVCLYPTYPQRTIEQIEEALAFFNASNANSMLCKKEINTHPYLCLEDIGDNKGKPFVESELYRWQDFPKCFQYSHYITIIKADELNNLNFQLYNSETIYFSIADIIDVDSEYDFKKYIHVKNNTDK